MSNDPNSSKQSLKLSLIILRILFLITANLMAFLVTWIAILGWSRLLLKYSSVEFFCTILLACLKLRSVFEETLRYMLLLTPKN